MRGDHSAICPVCGSSVYYNDKNEITDKICNNCGCHKFTGDELDFSAHYSVSGYRGIAFYLVRYSTDTREGETFLECPEPRHELLADHEDYCFVVTETEEVTNPQMVIAVMVGDDTEHIIDIDDLTLLSDEDFDPECGQIGCGWGH